jgi:hypothetical protein
MMDDLEFDRFQAEVSAKLDQAIEFALLRNFDKAQEIAKDVRTLIESRLHDMDESDREHAELLVRNLEETIRLAEGLGDRSDEPTNGHVN